MFNKARYGIDSHFSFVVCVCQFGRTPVAAGRNELLGGSGARKFGSAAKGLKAATHTNEK